MKKIIYALLALFITFSSVWAGTTTTNYDLYKPSQGETGWANAINNNFDTIDSQMKENEDATGDADSDSTWTLHNSYPSDCASGEFVSGIGDTLTCATPTGSDSGDADSDSDWTLHNSYPSGCDSGEFVTAVGDTLTCDVPEGSGSGTEWDNDGSYIFTDDTFSRVGINTSKPEHALDVVGVINANSDLRVNNVSVCLSDNTNCYPASPSGWVDNGTSVVLETSTDNVGIGTINPVSKLHVAGALTVDGEFSGIHLEENGMQIDGDTTNEMTFSQTGGTNNGTLLLNLEDSATDAIFSSTNKTGVNWTSLDFVTSGTVTANAFVGDGSGLTGLAAGGGWVDGGTNVYVSPTTDNVAIGTTTPLATLMVNNTGTGDSFRVDDSQTDATPFIITSNGNVGIGTHSPASLLEVGPGSTFSVNSLGKLAINHNQGNTITSTSGGNSALAITANSQTSASTLAVSSSNSGLTASIAALTYSGTGTGNTLTLTHSGASSGNALLVNASNSSYTGNAVKITNAGTGNTMLVEDVATDTTPFIISSVGNVGIGTTNPSTNLHLVGEARITGLVSCDTIDTDSDGVLSCGTDDSSGASAWLDGGTNVYVSPTTDNVGIGTTTPTQKLTVVGTINATTFTGANVTSGANPGHTHTGSSLSGIDISDDTNLAGTSNEIVLTDDTLSLSSTVKGWSDGGSTIRTSTTTDAVGIGTTTVSDGILQIGGDNVTIGIGGTNTTATGAGELYVKGDLEVDGTITGDGSGITGLSAGGWTDGGTVVYPTTTTDQVGIGTFTPVAGAALTVNGSIAGSGSGAMTITNGNVGIGTSTALSTLLFVSSTGGTVSSAGAGDVYIQNDLEVDGTVYMGSCSGAGCAGSSGWTDGGTQVILSTTTDSVGIGTSNPGVALDVNGSSAANISSRVKNTNSSGLASVKVYNSADLGFEMVATGSGYAVPSTYGVLATAGESLSFGESDGTINMRINPAGTVRFTPTDSPDTCNAGNEGSLYYDNSLNEFCDCDGSSWAQVDGGGAC